MKSDLAKIPYIVHKARLFKVYEEKKRIRNALILTNVIWAIMFMLFAMR